MIKNNLYIWSCDFSKFTGEGNLGRLFVKIKLKNYNNIIIEKKFSNSLLGHKYILPFIGIYYCWIYYLSNKKVCYLNYLPLWNIFIFILLPPNTILGPITGGALYKKSFSLDFFFRKYFFSSLYFISSIILLFRKSKIYFSTSLLKKYLLKKVIIKSKFDFFMNGILINKKLKNKKKYDFIIYYKKHKNKINMYPINLIKRLIMFKFRIVVVGDRLNLSGLKNYGYLSKNKLKDLLLKTNSFISSNENLTNFFAIDCINNNVKIVTTKKYTELNKKFENNIIYLPKENLSKENFEKILNL